MSFSAIVEMKSKRIQPDALHSSVSIVSVHLLIS